MGIFHAPRTVNDPFGDPCVFISFARRKRAVLFDLGDISSLSARDVLKITHVFVSHTHMDHFSGFDSLLRLLLGRERDLFIFGPEGIIKNMEGKLAGYSWNLVSNYSAGLVIHVREMTGKSLLCRSYACNQAFAPGKRSEVRPVNGVIHIEPSFTVTAAILDHDIPCLGFMLKEKFQVNIVKERLAEFKLHPGPWLNDFKEALYNASGEKGNEIFHVEDCGGKRREFDLQELARKIAIITPGQKTAYVTDVGCSDSNVEKILNLARDANHIFIEAAFADKERDTAGKKHHLTAKQAGTISRAAGAERMTVFHFSPRYSGNGELLLQEAQKAFRGL